VNRSLYYAVLEHRGKIDPKVVMPTASPKTGHARQRTAGASKEASEI
jgi:hypothetical protein